MSAITAQILVGQAPDGDRAGIIPTHSLFLSENGQPTWILVPQNLFEPESSKNQQQVTWIPTAENLLEDALLMIAIHVLKEPSILELAKIYFKKDISDCLDLSEDIEIEKLKKIYEKCREIDNVYKIAIAGFEDSAVKSQLKILKKYKMDVEVCTRKYYRLHSKQTGKTKTKGTLVNLVIKEEDIIAMANDPQIQAEIAAINRDFAILAAMDLEKTEGV